MPGRQRIYDEISERKGSGQDFVRRNYLEKLAKYTKRDTIIFYSAFCTYKSRNLPDFSMMISQEDIQGLMAALHGLKNDKLDLIISSPGGSGEAAEQIVNYLRNKYDHIRAIIPQNAMSAATMIACACDVI